MGDFQPSLHFIDRQILNIGGRTVDEAERLCGFYRGLVGGDRSGPVSTLQKRFPHRLRCSVDFLSPLQSFPMTIGLQALLDVATSVEVANFARNATSQSAYPEPHISKYRAISCPVFSAVVGKASKM